MGNGLRQTDLIDLVAFAQNESLYKALQSISKILGIDYYHDFQGDMPESLKITRLILGLNNGFDAGSDTRPLKPINPKILEYYRPYVNDIFLNDNIDYLTQQEFSVGYDEETNRITIPIFSEIGDLVGVKGRLFKTELDENELKYIYLEPCSRSKILFGLNKTYPHIKRLNRVYVTEAEKGCMQLWSMGYQNGVATGGKNISPNQMEMLVRLGVDIVFAFDKDVKKQDIEELAAKFVDKIPIYYIFDEDNILSEKESPTDNKSKWQTLLKNNLYKIK